MDDMSAARIASPSKILSRKIIDRAIKDLGRGNDKDAEDAQRYFQGELFQQDRKAAGYPPELLDTLNNMVLISEIGRRVLCRDILKLLADAWDS